MKSKIAIRMLATLISMATLAPFTGPSAALVNGGFESGDFSGWTVLNPPATDPSLAYGAVVPAASGYGPLQGDYSALLISKSTAPIDGVNTCATDIWNVACPDPIPYPNAPAGGPLLSNPFTPSFHFGTDFYFSAVIGQDFEAKAGDQLSWEWDRLGEPVDVIFAWMTDGITQIGYNVTSLGFGCNVERPLGYLSRYEGPIGGNLGNIATSCTELDASSWPDEIATSIPTDGTWTIYFGADQRPDSRIWTGLLLDDVKLQRVPEPATLALLSLGLAGLAITRRRKQ